MGTVLLRLLVRGASAGSAGFSPLLDGDGIASKQAPHLPVLFYCFSPLLDGDGIASPQSSATPPGSLPVSVPFSMGTVLLLKMLLSERDGDLGFSPLLDGDGIASHLPGHLGTL